MEEVHRGPGRPKSLAAEELLVLKEVVEARPDISLRELVKVLVERCGKHAAPITVSRGLKGLGIHKVPARKAPSEEQPKIKTTRYRAIHRREPASGRYPSSLTDHEWQALCAILEPEQDRGRPRVHDRRAMWDAVFYLVRGGELGACSHRIYLPTKPCSRFSPGRATQAFWSRSINACMPCGASGADGMNLRARVWSTASRLRRLKKGALRLRRGEEGKRSEAFRRGRYPWPTDLHPDPFGLSAGT